MANRLMLCSISEGLLRVVYIFEQRFQLSYPLLCAVVVTSQVNIQNLSSLDSQPLESVVLV